MLAIAIKRKLLLFLPCFSLVYCCPYARTTDTGTQEVPNDPQHRALLRKRRDTQRAKHSSIIAKAQRRNLQQTFDCLTSSTYNNLMDDVADLGNSINNSGDRGHFFGGIVRLAAHDFMDFDRNSNVLGGSDGCIDFSAADNKGLELVWCDGCALTELYEVAYSSAMSRADFWVAAANASIKATARDNFEPPFHWGRTDSGVCPESSGRLPLDTDCGEVEGVFLDRMGLTWTDATALLGAHTIGRGSTVHSGHDGRWVQNAQESALFDRGYYDELLDRNWRPRSRNGAQFDWVWGGNNRDVMMLNIDICLFYDIDSPNCCTLNNNDNACNRRCSQSTNSVTVAAIQRFTQGNGNNNGPFYDAFSEAWVKATENGRDGLKDLDADCSPVPPAPTSSPVTSAPTPIPITRAPTESPPPTKAPVTQAPTKSPPPTRAPVTLAPTKSPRPTTDDPLTCKDRDCKFVVKNGLCDVYGELCPESCNLNINGCGGNGGGGGNNNGNGGDGDGGNNNGNGGGGKGGNNNGNGGGGNGGNNNGNGGGGNGGNNNGNGGGGKGGDNNGNGGGGNGGNNNGNGGGGNGGNNNGNGGGGKGGNNNGGDGGDGGDGNNNGNGGGGKGGNNNGNGGDGGDGNNNGNGGDDGGGNNNGNGGDDGGGNNNGNGGDDGGGNNNGNGGDDGGGNNNGNGGGGGGGNNNGNGGGGGGGNKIKKKNKK